MRRVFSGPSSKSVLLLPAVALAGLILAAESTSANDETSTLREIAERYSGDQTLEGSVSAAMSAAIIMMHFCERQEWRCYGLTSGAIVHRYVSKIRETAAPDESLDDPLLHHAAIANFAVGALANSCDLVRSGGQN